MSGKCVRAHPELCDRFQVVLVHACYGELLTTLNLEQVFARRPRLNLLNKRSIDQHGAVNAYKPVRFQLFGHGRERLPEQIGSRPLFQQDVVALSADYRYLGRIDEKNSSLGSDGDLGSGLCERCFKKAQGFQKPCGAIVFGSSKRNV